MKKLAELAVLIFCGIASWAQEVRNEVTVHGSGFFQKQTSNGGITNEPSNSGGSDVPVSKHFLVRTHHRGFVYKVPDFEMTSLKLDKYTHSAVPSAGLVFTF
jgi:hypothetical protein